MVDKNKKLKAIPKRKHRLNSMTDRLQQILNRFKTSLTKNAPKLSCCTKLLKTTKNSGSNSANSQITLPSKQDLENRLPTINATIIAQASFKNQPIKPGCGGEVKVQTPYRAIRQRLPKNAVIYEESRVSSLNRDLYHSKNNNSNDEAFSGYKSTAPGFFDRPGRRSAPITADMRTKSLNRYTNANSQNMNNNNNYDSQTSKNEVSIHNNVPLSIISTGYSSLTSLGTSYKTLPGVSNSCRTSSGYESSEGIGLEYNNIVSAKPKSKSTSGAKSTAAVKSEGRKSIFEEMDGYKQLNESSTIPFYCHSRNENNHGDDNANDASDKTTGFHDYANFSMKTAAIVH